MKVETLAKKMRDRAIQIELEESAPIANKKSRQLPKPEYKSVEERIEEIKKLYFNAGRWAGGARDHNARMANHQLAQDENR
jgi:hypothetical protein